MVDTTNVRLVRRNISLALESSRPGFPDSRVVILDRASDTLPYVTTNGKYILIQNREKGSVRTSVFSALSGRKTGQISDEFNLNEAKLTGSELYYVSPSSGGSDLELHGVRIPEGSSLWQRKISLPASEAGPNLPR